MYGIEKLREELIKDILTYIEEKECRSDIDENTITQIIVDSFDEYEYNNQQAKLYTEDIKAQDRELNKKYK